MALTDESSGNGFYMPVAPAYGGGYGNGGGFFGGDWAWIILLLLIGGGGWGLGGFGGGMMWPMMMGGMGGGFGLDYLYPWLNNSQHISDGFRDQQITTYLNGLQQSITSGFGDVQLGLAGINQNICQTGNAITGAITNGQIANMQSIFGVQSALQNCCCENRAATQDLKYTIATEACADRAAVTQGIQTVLDKLCQLELDGYKREADSLRTQLSEARLAASQTAQNAFISQGFANEVDALYNRLNSCPVPTTPVYGRTPIFTCGGNNVGCGCGNAFMN